MRLSLPFLLLFAFPAWAGPPNIVVMMTDDQRYDFMSHMGHPFLKTPNMDRIAAEGARCKNMFVTNALCAPSRATLMTGHYSHSHGVRDNMGSKLRDDVPWMPDQLRAAGYEVAFCGKSHVPGHFREKNWDYYFGFRGQGNYLKPVIAEGTAGEDKPYDGYMDDVVTDHAIAWMKRPRTKPFALFLFFKAPHRRWDRAERFKELYKDVEVRKPELWDHPGAGKPSSFLMAANMFGQFPDTKDFGAMVKDYCACIAAVDENIGRVMATLEGMKALDDTAVMFTSDNGFFMGEWQRFDKRFMHEPSIRVPWLIRYPKLARPGTAIEPMVINVDIAPTLLDLAGLKPSPAIHGRSILPLLKGDTSGWRKDWLYEYFEYPDPSHAVRKNRGIRTEKYKYIHYFEKVLSTDREEFELYDLVEDPQEKVNLYPRPKYQPVVKELRDRLEQLRRETGETE
ncbi:MAG: sulfatase [Gemmataceae bacterium]|nr:sulfatase [Gemmataceae bacterium]